MKDFNSNNELVSRKKKKRNAANSLLTLFERIRPSSFVGAVILWRILYIVNTKVL
jgi:hypothetical protein